MNCYEVCAHLPGLLYGDLSPHEVAAVEHHLTACPACRRERAALEHVRQALSAVPAPAVQVDLPRLFQEAAQRQARRARRWRRAALALGAVAALLILALGLNVQVRFEGRRLTVSWGPAPAEKPEPAPKAPPAPPMLADRKNPPKAGPDIEERLRVMNDLIHAIAADVQARDGQQRQNLAALQDQVTALARQAAYQWKATEQNSAALQVAQLTGTPKGENP
jgi:hypothetical protein